MKISAEDRLLNRIEHWTKIRNDATAKVREMKQELAELRKKAAAEKEVE